MPLPHLRYAFVEVGSLKVGCYAIFSFFLLVCGFFMNRYLGMYRLTLLLDENLASSPQHDMKLKLKREACGIMNLSKDIIEVKRSEYVTMKPKGSFIIGTISALYWLASVYGLISMILQEPELLIPPLIIYPVIVFLDLFLIFFDLGITETKGFLYFYVLTGFVTKLIISAVTAYCFLIIYSFYKEQTGGQPPDQELKTAQRPKPEPKQIIYPTIQPPPTATTSVPQPVLPLSPLLP